MSELLPKHHISIFSLNWLIIFTLINHSIHYIILPFKSRNIEINLNKNTTTKQIDGFLSEINEIQLYSLISFGNPPKNVEFYFTMKKTIYSVLSNFCPKGTFSSYNPYSSQTFKNSSKNTFSFDNIIDGFAVSDNCSFFIDSNLKESKTIDSFEFIIGNNTSPGYKDMETDKFCGSLGLVKNPNEFYLFAKNFISYLNEEKIINSYSWGIFFFDKEKSYNIDNNIQKEYDGLYIAGISEDDYSKIFKAINVTKIYSDKTNNNINYNKIFYFDSPKNKTEHIISNDSTIELILDNNYIISDLECYEKIKSYFFKKYFDDNVCYENSTYKIFEGKYYMIICDSRIKSNIKYFPTFYFYNRELAFTFNLDYNDVFLELDNIIYFLIIGNDITDTTWKLGKSFMKKYPFIFDQDKKSLYFVHLEKFGDQNNDREKENKNFSNFWQKFKVFLIISLLFIGIVLGIFIGKKIWKKNRKIRCNELKDEEEKYEYMGKNDKFTKIIE